MGVIKVFFQPGTSPDAGVAQRAGRGRAAAYGGKQRLVSVDLDMKALEAKNLSSQDVVTALSNQNIVFPSGNARSGEDSRYDRTIIGTSEISSPPPTPDTIK